MRPEHSHRRRFSIYCLKVRFQQPFPVRKILPRSLTMPKNTLLISMITVCCFFTTAVVTEDTIDIQPNLESGKVYDLNTLPKTWFDFVYPSHAICGKNASICWYSIPPELHFPFDGIVMSEEQLIYVIKGPVTLQTNQGKKVLHNTDCMRFTKGDQCKIVPGPDSAELLVIDWPVSKFIMSVKQWNSKTTPSTALSPTSAPSLSFGSTIFLRDMEKVPIDKDILGCFVQGERGQLICLSTLSTAGKISQSTAKKVDVEEDIFSTSEGDLKITFIGHGSYMFTFNNTLRSLQTRRFGRA